MSIITTGASADLSCPSSAIPDSYPAAPLPAHEGTEPTSSFPAYANRAIGSAMTRRTIMNALVALPIVGVSYQPSPSIAYDVPNNLAAVRRDLDQAVIKLTDARRRYDAINAKVLPWIAPIKKSLDAEGDRWTQEQRKSAHWAIRHFEETIGGDEWEAAVNAHEDAWLAVDNITETILELGDPALVASATALANFDFWRGEFDNLDWDKKMVVLLVEAAHRAAGLPTVQEYLSINIPAMA